MTQRIGQGRLGCAVITNNVHIFVFISYASQVSWKLYSTPSHFGTQADKSVTILKVASHCIEVTRALSFQNAIEHSDLKVIWDPFTYNSLCRQVALLKPHRDTGVCVQSSYVLRKY